jgi:hypothetical protein
LPQCSTSINGHLRIFSIHTESSLLCFIKLCARRIRGCLAFLCFKIFHWLSKPFSIAYRVHCRSESIGHVSALDVQVSFDGLPEQSHYAGTITSIRTLHLSPLSAVFLHSYWALPFRDDLDSQVGEPLRDGYITLVQTFALNKSIFLWSLCGYRVFEMKLDNSSLSYNRAFFIVHDEYIFPSTPPFEVERIKESFCE